MNTPAQSSAFDRGACDSADSAVDAALDASTRVAWFYDPPSRGTWNMALDEALLLQAAEGGPPTLRFYQWDQPTLSLGYFQRNADRQLHGASLRCPVVRRTSGGGAILHDRELTYSCALPSKHGLARRAGDLYYAIHESIVAVLSKFGFIAHLQSCEQPAPDSPAKATSPHGFGCGATQQTATVKSMGDAQEPFLCFQRRTAGDIIFNGQKVVGSAQRRCRGAVLQHGSILVARSEYAPELPGIRDLGVCQLDARDLADPLRKALGVRLKFDLVSDLPSQATIERAAAIEASKFAAEPWLRLR
jgi:lipoate-protein ligase A